MTDMSMGVGWGEWGVYPTPRTVTFRVPPLDTSYLLAPPPPPTKNDSGFLLQKVCIFFKKNA